MRSTRPLTRATFIPAFLTVLALPFGFVDEGVAVLAGIYGLYFALPAVVAWWLDAMRSRLPRHVQRVLGGLIVLVATMAVGFWVFFAGPLLVLAVPPIAVVFVVAFRLLRARSDSHPTASGASSADSAED
jgi:hypothetical protein